MPTVVAHDLAQATAAARAAAAAGRRLAVRSAPGAGRSLGVAGWLALADMTRTALPSADLTFSLDCAGDAGDAHAALAFGATRVALDPAAPGYARVAALAAEIGATIDAEPADLDLAFVHDPEAAIGRLLKSQN